MHGGMVAWFVSVFEYPVLVGIPKADGGRSDELHVVEQFRAMDFRYR